MLLYAVRHAESQANVDKRAGLNSGLSPLGVDQTNMLAGLLTGFDFDAIYSSPFLRCIQTALPIARALKLPIRIRPDLCEHHHLPLGSTDQTHLPTIEALAGQFAEVQPCPDHDAPFEWVPVDETLPQLCDRMQRMAGYLKSCWTADDNRVLVISHGSPIARLIDAWLTNTPGPSFRFIIDNAAVNALRLHAGVSSLVCLNERSHLGGLPAPAAANFDAKGLIKPLPPSSYW